MKERWVESLQASRLQHSQVFEESADLEYAVSLLSDDGEDVSTSHSYSALVSRKTSFLGDMPTRMYSIGLMQIRLDEFSAPFVQFLRKEDVSGSMLNGYWPVLLQYETKVLASINSQVLELQRWSEGQLFFPFVYETVVSEWYKYLFI